MISYVCEYGDTTTPPSRDSALPAGWTTINIVVVPPPPPPTQPGDPPPIPATPTSYVGHVCPNHADPTADPAAFLELGMKKA